MINVLDTEGTIVDANRMLSDELGYPADELIGTKIWEHDRLVDAADVLTQLEEMSVGEQQKFEGEYQCRDGSTFPVEVHLIRIDLEDENRFIAISRDITERKERERDLRETKRRLELALEGTNTGVWEWDLEADTVDWNETYEGLLGIDPGRSAERSTPSSGASIRTTWPASTKRSPERSRTMSCFRRSSGSDTRTGAGSGSDPAVGSYTTRTGASAWSGSTTTSPSARNTNANSSGRRNS